MRKHVLVISASLRTGSNSELLADAFTVSYTHLTLPTTSRV